MLPYLQDRGRMYSISNPQEVSGLAKLDFLSEFSASDGTKKAQRSSTILHTLPVHRRAICFCLPAHAGSCGERKQQLRWQLTSVSRPRKFSPVLSWTHFTNTERIPGQNPSVWSRRYWEFKCKCLLLPVIFLLWCASKQLSISLLMSYRELWL